MKQHAPHPFACANAPSHVPPGKLSALMAEKQDVQTALDNASGQAEALKGQLAQAEASTTALQVRCGALLKAWCVSHLVV